MNKLLHPPYRILVGLTFLLFFFIDSHGKPIDRKVADSIAYNFFNGSPSLRSAAGICPILVDAPLGDKDGLRSSDQPLYYVYNSSNHKGFVLVSGDDKLPEILGYSYDNCYLAEKMPSHIKAFFEAFQKGLNDLLSLDKERIATYFAPSVDNGVKLSVSPLLGGIEWNQDSPWNDKTPILNNGEHAYVGCVATCMTQIMRYYEWPDRSEGEHEYTENGRRHKTTFGNIYRWDKMPEKISAGMTDEERNQLATLCADAGLAMDMAYWTFGSGTYMQNAVEGLARNFKYSKEAKVCARKMYTKAEWDHLIKSELSAGHPVGYAGASSDIGHAFVCDGYDQNGRFSINWGWGGLYNGYFFLEALNPKGTGIGGGNKGGYNFEQEAIIGFVPDRNHSTNWVTPTIGCNSFVLIGKKSADGSHYISFEEASVLPEMISHISFETNFRLELRNDANLSDTKTFEPTPLRDINHISIPKEVSLPCQGDFSELGLSPNTTYTAYPTYKNRNDLYEEVSHILACISKYKVRTDNQGRVVEITACDVTPHLKFVKGNFDLYGYIYNSASFTVDNSGEEYLGQVSLMYRESGTKKWYPLVKDYKSLAQGQVDLTYEDFFMPLPAGKKCDILLKANDGEGCILAQDMPIKNPHADLYGYMLMYDNGNPDQEDLVKIDINDVKADGFYIVNLGNAPITLSFEGYLEYISETTPEAVRVSVGKVGLSNIKGKRNFTLKREKNTQPVIDLYNLMKRERDAGIPFDLAMKFQIESFYGEAAYQYIPDVELYDSKDVAVNKVEQSDIRINIDGVSNQISVTGAKPNEMVALYSIDGRLIFKGKTNENGMIDFRANEQEDLLIIKIGHEVRKLAIKE
ncbi:C10 family peptidase [Falsiporphyromonas endometrii]|uniref:C10 family peptidase n=1 Tax=Falsiporphyromonas endometrii TaxID=1387297 RepID=A0ABV9K5J1_9PORP